MKVLCLLLLLRFFSLLNIKSVIIISKLLFVKNCSVQYVIVIKAYNKVCGFLRHTWLNETCLYKRDSRGKDLDI